MGIMTSIGSWLSLHGDGLCRIELTGNVAFLSRWVAAQCMFPLEAWTQWALLKWVVGGGRVLKEVAQVHAQTLDEFCPHQSPNCMVSHGLHVHLKLLYIHTLVGGYHCTAMEALAIEMSCAHGLGQGPCQYE